MASRLRSVADPRDAIRRAVLHTQVRLRALDLSRFDGLDELGEDEELDEESRALLQAMAEWEQRDMSSRATWDPLKHQRWPKGHPLGGKFRPMVDQILDALTAWQKTGSKGDPFKGFNREQLRKVALKRGITLRRGEDRDSIAAKLLADLGVPSAKTGKKPPAKKATPRPRKPKPLTPAQELARWKADASKPGRISVASSGPTKREEYVASWERGIAQTRKQIAEAEAKGDRRQLPDLRKYLDYQVKARDAIRDDPDPSLDEPAFGPTFKLVQKVDKDRPLAVYGDVLHLESSDDEWIRMNLTELEKIPAQLHGVVAAHMAKKADGGIWIGDTGISGMNHSHDLAGQAPRGWDDGQTFDDVNGVYRKDRRTMLVGRTENSRLRGDKTASHEFGHALDAALGTPSLDADWKAIHARALTEVNLSPYYRQEGHAGREEFWAEAFSAWVNARQMPSYDLKVAYIVRLHVSGDLGGNIHDYFDRIADRIAETRGVQ